MMSLYLLAWIASVMYAVEAILGKITSKHSIKNPWIFNFFWSLFIFIGMAIVAIFFGISIPTEWNYIIFGSLTYAIANVCYALSVYALDTSVLIPLYSMRTVMTVIVGTIFLGEILTKHQYILIGLIFIFGIFVSMDERFSIKSFFNRKIFIALFGMMFLLVESLLIKKSVAVSGFWNTTFWITLLGQVWLLGTIPFFKKDLHTTGKKQIGIMAIVSIASISGTIAAMAAYAKNVSIATAIISLPLSMVAIFVLSFIIPELTEKHTMKVYAVRFISAAVMIACALNL